MKNSRMLPYKNVVFALIIAQTNKTFTNLKEKASCFKCYPHNPFPFIIWSRADGIWSLKHLEGIRLTTLLFNLSQLSKIYQIYAKVLHNKQRQEHFSTIILLEQSIMKHDKPQELNNVYMLPVILYLTCITLLRL